ncbi:unnamed protein product [Boreogadus saida]
MQQSTDDSYPLDRICRPCVSTASIREQQQHRPITDAVLPHRGWSGLVRTWQGKKCVLDSMQVMCVINEYTLATEYSTADRPSEPALQTGPTDRPPDRPPDRPSRPAQQTRPADRPPDRPPDRPSRPAQQTRPTDPPDRPARQTGPADRPSRPARQTGPADRPNRPAQQTGPLDRPSRPALQTGTGDVTQVQQSGPNKFALQTADRPVDVTVCSRKRLLRDRGVGGEEQERKAEKKS